MKGKKGEINSPKILYITECFDVMEENDKPMGETLNAYSNMLFGRGKRKRFVRPKFSGMIQMNRCYVYSLVYEWT